MADEHPILARLREVGFKAANDEASARRAMADDVGLHESGPYVVDGVLRKGAGDTAVTVTVEQNTSDEDLAGGMTAKVTYPPVAIIEGPQPGQRLAASPDDWDAVQAAIRGFGG